jgi:hypothetical protein
MPPAVDAFIEMLEIVSHIHVTQWRIVRHAKRLAEWSTLSSSFPFAPKTTSTDYPLQPRTSDSSPTVGSWFREATAAVICGTQTVTNRH